ncbi:hypothetical protein Tsubulata_026462 [Turnera subulata]|uniref:Agglutinin domain-containing protein n=1 Tax=Turnera subulata TaxID=218843 RepID=A0A9Q0IZA5_9ROSI|nr:hypothetical protein Tsubulata_026462 [Turnera subulata]
MALELHIKTSFALKYNDKFLGLDSVVKGNGEVHELLKPCGEQLANEEVTKFEFVASSGPDNGLVHIKCCHNNKYLRSLSPSMPWITPAEDKPEEDRTKWACTLFHPRFVDANTLELIHVESGGHVRPFSTSNNAYDSGLFAVPESGPDHLETHTFTTIFDFALHDPWTIRVDKFHLDDPRVRVDISTNPISVGQGHAENEDTWPKAMTVTTVLHDQ